MKKKKKTTSKKCKNTCDKKCYREKVCGEPMPVKPCLSYVNNEIYPKILFKETWWTKFKRFIGLVP